MCYENHHHFFHTVYSCKLGSQSPACMERCLWKLLHWVKHHCSACAVCRCTHCLMDSIWQSAKHRWFDKISAWWEAPLDLSVLGSPAHGPARHCRLLGEGGQWHSLPATQNCCAPEPSGCCGVLGQPRPPDQQGRSRGVPSWAQGYPHHGSDRTQGEGLRVNTSSESLPRQLPVLPHKNLQQHNLSLQLHCVRAADGYLPPMPWEGQEERLQSWLEHQGKKNEIPWEPFRFSGSATYKWNMYLTFEETKLSLDINISVGNLNCCSVPWTWEKSSVFLKIVFLEFVMFYVKIHWTFKKRSLISLCAVFFLVQTLSTFCLLKAIHRKCWMWFLAISHSSEEFH